MAKGVLPVFFNTKSLDPASLKTVINRRGSLFIKDDGDRDTEISIFCFVKRTRVSPACYAGLESFSDFCSGAKTMISSSFVKAYHMLQYSRL
jgi:hypothetical protein